MVEWMRENLGWKTVLIVGVIYAILLSMPFFHGVELAWLVILIFGKEAIIVFYLFTIIGLCWSFAVGRWLEGSWLTARYDLKNLNLRFSRRIDSLSQKINGVAIFKIARPSSKKFLFHSRYVILAILVNIPGNAIIGGGGGIALLCGMNRSFSLRGFIITIALAVSPVPILLFLGLIQVENLIA